jgi:hypothetical protein
MVPSLVADHSRVQLKNAWASTSTPPIYLHVLVLKHGDNLTLHYVSLVNTITENGGQNPLRKHLASY